MGKGDKRRPQEVDFREYDLNWMLAVGRLTQAEYEEELKRLNKNKKKC